MALLGSAAINQGRHVGLQQLEAVTAGTRTFLGPSKRYKMIQDEASGEAVLVCSCYRLLEQLELSGSAAQLLRETTRAYWGTLRSGTASLLFLAGVWSRVALECLHQGISVRHIVSGMSKGLEMCLEACKLSAVTVELVVCKADLQKQQPTGKSQSSGDCMTVEDDFFWKLSLSKEVRDFAQDSAKTVNSVPTLIKKQRSLKHNLKLKHSRHFNSSHITEDGSTHTSFDIARLAAAVCHGCEKTMSLVIEASRIQCRYSCENQGCGIRALDVDKLVTCLLPGLSEEHSSVLHGYVVLLSSEQALQVKRLEERTLKISLVHGDLSLKHRHIGFNRPRNVTYVSDCSELTGISREEEWMDEALRILLNLKVDIVLVSGGVTEQLKHHCFHHHILIIEHVRVSILSDFATATGALPVSYITQLSERCIGSGVCVNTLRVYRTEGTEWTVVNVVTDGTALVTALIASSIHAKIQSMEDQFWSCAYRVHHALKDGKLLPGAGTAELICIHQLQNHGNISKPEERGDELDAARAAAPYEEVILQLMAEAWMDYVSTLMVNTGHVMSKTQAWTCIAQHVKQWESRSPWNNEIPETLLKTENYSEIMHRGGESEEKGMLKRERVKMGVYDSMTLKFEVWRRALDLVFLILQTDTEIITGINDREGQYRDSVIL